MISKLFQVLLVYLALSCHNFSDQTNAFKCTKRSCNPPPVTPCGNWASYFDEQCFKVFENAGMVSYENAAKFCQEEGGHLIRIFYPEVQNFLRDLFFVNGHIVDDIWLGASFDAEDSEYKWQENSSLTFTNWADNYPRNRDDHCVKMSSDFEWLGKWTDESCLRRNLVACQKKPILQLAQIQEILLEVKQSLIDTLKDYELTKQNLTVTKQKLSIAEGEIARVKQNQIPIGFVFIQLPKEKPPTEIWPSMTWTDVSTTYAGVFFRVLGGNAARFGEVQTENSPRLNKIESADGYQVVRKVENVLPGIWTPKIFSGLWGGHDMSLKFFVSNDEVRPRNMAVRIWKRTG